MEPRYVERLWASWGWWAVSTTLACTLALAFGVPLGAVPGLVCFVCTEAIVVWVLVSSAATVTVDDAMLKAGRARLPVAAIGAVTALDVAAAARLRGVDADPRAYLLLRPWLAVAVRIDVRDPTDPTPYWYVSTRHPEQLAAALSALSGRSRDVDDSKPVDGAG